MICSCCLGWNEETRQGLIKFSSGANGGQRGRINHWGQQQSASLLVRTQACRDKLHVSCSIIKHCWEHNQDSGSTKDICFSLFFLLTGFMSAFVTSLRTSSTRTVWDTLSLSVWNTILTPRSSIHFTGVWSTPYLHVFLVNEEHVIL